MDTKSPIVRDNGLVRRFCAGRSRFDDAPQVLDEQAAILVEDAIFLTVLASMMPASPATEGLLAVAGRLRTDAGESA